MKAARKNGRAKLKAYETIKSLIMSGRLGPGQAVTETALSTLQPASVLWTELEAPKPDRFVGNRDAALRQQFLNVPKAHAESVVEPDRVADDLGRKSISIVAWRLAVHWPTVSITSSI